MRSFLLLMVLCFAVVVSRPAFAQDQAVEATPDGNYVTIIDVPETAPTAPAEGAAVVASAPPASTPQNSLLSTMEREINERLAYLQPKVDINDMTSLFFNVWEHDLIMDARRGLTTGIGDEGIAKAGERDISLGGIVYVNGGDWTVWINKTRVTPTAIPAQIMDLKVYKEHIDLEWFDATTNQIFPIRLRSHQRFNLDSRIFLPG